MTNRSQYNHTDSKLHPETIPTAEKMSNAQQQVGYNHTDSKLHPETIPTIDRTSSEQKRVGVVEEVPLRRETVTTTNSTSHSDSNKSKKSKQDYSLSLPLLGVLACCIPLAGILGYLIRGERVVIRTVTQQVPSLVVPASPGVTPSAVSPAPNVVSPSPVGPAIVGPARVGPDRVGNK